ncbi:MAG: hypothetical protein Q7J03_06215, partial [Methanoregula sp.]|nr:hypothetical protein [Methanoregula sp.]
MAGRLSSTFIRIEQSAFITEVAVSTFSILIVEDDFIVAKVIEKSLIDLGYSIAGLAATAEDAIAIARRERP